MSFREESVTTGSKAQVIEYFDKHGPPDMWDYLYQAINQKTKSQSPTCLIQKIGMSITLPQDVRNSVSRENTSR